MVSVDVEGDLDEGDVVDAQDNDKVPLRTCKVDIEETSLLSLVAM